MQVSFDQQCKSNLTIVKSVLQDWVMQLPLRHQGVLLTCVRGCDTAPKHDPSKLFTRCLREKILNPFVGDSKKAATFIEWVPTEVFHERFTAFRKNLDHYPHHYVMHVIHAIQVIGYKHSDEDTRIVFKACYLLLCKGLHMKYENEAEMDRRLTLDEIEFAKVDRE